MCLKCEVEVFFSIWHPDYLSDVEKTLAFLKFPIWVQFLGVH